MPIGATLRKKLMMRTKLCIGLKARYKDLVLGLALQREYTYRVVLNWLKTFHPHNIIFADSRKLVHIGVVDKNINDGFIEQISKRFTN